MMNQQTPTNNIPLSSLFSSDEIICGSTELDEEELLHRLIERIGNSGKLRDIEEAFTIIIQLKCCSLTYLLPEVAVFHARIPGMKSLGIALAVIPSGIECCWTTGETKTIKLVVLVLTPHKEPGGYMRTITAISKVCQRKGFLTNIYKATEPEKIWDYFDQEDMQLPEFVTAGDIMRTTFHSLRDTDSLSEAIDAFCRYGISELPVLDIDGDLVGVVSEDELIRICLPEYITWMEDLSAILDFQPFAEILLREKDMPVVEISILADRYATVEETTPAIQVAKVMMRRDVRRVLVVRENRLLGIITIQDFINKVMRA
ncbi:MAG: CBS domain-containing protein [gamma proteobacterium endosymbiont of Lamellibrachia anaximandri]|nr:CBS domain-containing protein [gamma proteobacterium endosymbiont of Lamellibrachia anaximandri]